MAASLAKQVLTFSKLSSLRHIVGGAVSVRHKSLKNYDQDLRPEHVHQNDPARIEEQPGAWKKYTDLSYFNNSIRNRKYLRKLDQEAFDPQRVNKMLRQMDLKKGTVDDQPDESLVDPYQMPPQRCLLCQFDIKLDYKNVQLLSQFVSPYTGRIYGRHITGLCLYMQQRVAREIRTARRFGFMPYMNKLPQYLEDPNLYNPFHRKKFPYGH